MVLCRSRSVATSELPEPVSPENYHYPVTALPPDSLETLLPCHNNLPLPQRHQRALITPGTHQKGRI